jgi:hypothetical protein
MEGKTEKELNPKWKESKKHLDREEKKLGKISDKNTKLLRHTKTVALNKFK